MMPAVRAIQAFRSNALEFFSSYGVDELGVTEVDLGVRKTLMVGGPAFAVAVLTSDAFEKGQQTYGPLGTFAGTRSLHGLAGPSLPILDGEEGLTRRRHLHAVFKTVLARHAVVAARAPVQFELSEGPVDMYAALSHVVFRRFCDVMFGRPYADEEVEISEVVARATTAIDVLSKSWMPYAGMTTLAGLELRRCRDRLRAFADRAVEDLQTWSADEPVPSMRALLDEGLTREEVRDEIITQIMAGTETTTITSSWAMVELTRHRGILERLRAGEPELLQWVTKEAMRMYPSFWIIMRVAKEDVEIEGRRVRAGTVVFVSPWCVHHNEAFWPDAHRFHPERFQGRARVRGDYMPFGYGARACIGGRMANAIAMDVIGAAARQLDLSFVDGESDGPEIDPLIPVLRSRTGFRFHVRPR